MSTVEHGMVLHRYRDLASCRACPIKGQCTTGKERRITRWEHEAVIDAMQARMDRAPKIMRVRRATVEHPFGTLKAWIGATHFRMRTLEKVKTEMSLHVLAYNLKRVIQILGVAPLMDAIRA
jgi:transposase